MLSFSKKDKKSVMITFFDEKYVKIFEEIIAKIDGLSVDKINENVSDYSVYETLFGSVTNNFAIIRI